MTASKVFKIIGLTLLRIGLLIFVLFITMYLWNSLIPILFHGPVISFWQTAGLIILSKIIFSGMVPVGRPRHNSDGWHGKFHKQEREDWLKMFKEKKDKENPSPEV
jgi:hypothetical protein